MSPRDFRNVAASIRQRLLDRSRELGEEFQALLSDYGRERFLARLQHSLHAESLILKGAALFRVWDHSPHRVTRDSDFLALGDPSEDAVASVVRAICEVTAPVDDGLVFDADSIRADPIREANAYQGVRVRFRATLDGAEIPLQIDFAFGDTVVPAPVAVEYPTLLDFPPPVIRAYPPESIVAEKFQAMVALGEANTRFKDFYDIWYISRRFEFEGPVLTKAIRATFDRRVTAIPRSSPIALTDDHAESPSSVTGWRAFVNRAVPDGESTPPFSSVVAACRGFVMPVASAIADARSFQRRWAPGGPWEGK